ncbi:hypothetical protein ACFLWU_00195 [Chloroflexota bacterium]
MTIAVVWNDTKSFKRHLEYMRVFRQSHKITFGTGTNRLKNMPALCGIDRHDKSEGTRDFNNTSGRPIVVYLWDIELPNNSQN